MMHKQTKGLWPMGRDKARTLWALFVIFFKAGTFTFAGGLAMLPVIQKDVVETYRLMDKDEFLEYATLAQTLPGVIALNCASFVGLRAAGTLGMLAAGFGATISAFALMLLATVLIQLVPDNGPAVGAMNCVRAASSALVLSAAFQLGRHNLKSAFGVALMLLVFVAVLFGNVSALLCVALAGLIGWLWSRRQAKGGEAK